MIALWHRLMLMMMTAFLLAACSSGTEKLMGPEAGLSTYQTNSRVVSTPQNKVGYDSVGTASWYGERYHGQRTASGEIFDMSLATAAHPSFPFGTRVRVTNLENGRSIILRINDRGPFVRNRIIDVSKSAAQALGFVRQGTARVGIQIVQRAPD